MNPDQIKQLREKYGVPAGGYGSPQSSADTTNADRLARFDSALGDRPVKKLKDTTAGGIVSKTIDTYKSTGKKLMEDVKIASDQLSKGMAEGDTGKAVGGALRGGLRTVGAVTGAAFAPVTATLEQAGEELAKNETFSEKIAPQVQRILDRLGNNEAAQKVKEFIDANPEKAKDIADIVDIATLGYGKTVEKPIATASKEVLDSAVTKFKQPLINAAKKTSVKATNIIDDIALKSEKKALNKQITKAADAITPNTKDLTPTEYELLVKKGKIQPKTKSSPDKYILSEEENIAADKYKNLLQDKDPVKNTSKLMDEITVKDKQVGEFLAKNNSIYDEKELKSYLTDKLSTIDDLTVDEKRLLKLKKSTIDNFVKGLPTKDMDTLWKKRKEFDKTIESAFSGSPTLQKEIKREFRNGVQDFIADKTPDTVYKDAMKDMTQLFRLADTTAEKAVKERGLNSIQLWIKRNPTKAKALGIAVGSGAVGTLGAAVLK